MTQEIRTILCPIDFSEPARGAFQEALSLAARFGARVEVIHTVEIPHPSTPAIADGLRDYAQKELDKLVNHLPKSDVEVSAHVSQGSPAQTIVERAKAIDADLIVLSTHGRSGFVHAMLGSVAERIVRLAPCKVLTIPASLVEGESADA